jgi:hypothetical protein
MDPKTAQILLGAAGAAGAGGPLYVDDVFSTYTYEGTSGGDAQTITNGLNLSGEGGLVWIKSRGVTSGTYAAANHVLTDTERGANKLLYTSSTSVEQTGTWGVNSFNTSGFGLTGGDATNNADGYEYCSWSFRKAPGFFDIVTYTGNGSNRTIPHNLGSAPGMMIISGRDIGTNKTVYHRSLGPTKHLKLNSTADQASGNSIWNSTDPTSSVFSLGTHESVNSNGYEYVAWIFAHDDQSFGANEDEAIIKCGSYMGNGSSNGPTIDLGFEPQWLLIRNRDQQELWYLLDTMRGLTVDGSDQHLKPNETSAESSDPFVNLQSTGFQLKSSSSAVNSSFDTFIYVAIRRPHKPPQVGTDVFAIDQRVATAPNMVSGFVTDAALRKPVANTYKPQFASRLTGPKYVRTSETDSELDFGFTWDYMDGFHEDASTADSNIYSWMFKRAPGFMDVVAYTGTGSDLTVSHNLGVTPELIIAKSRSATGAWYVYPGPVSGGDEKHIKVNSSAGIQSNTGHSWTPTATTFKADTYLSLSDSATTYIAVLFASLSGISKVGTYTFSGSDIDVDCGFTNGARFVLIKGLDSGKDWSLFDATRGIVSGNDPKLSLNNADPHDTGGDWIDPINSGFRVLASAGNDVSDSGVEYLFLAIA